MTKRLAEFELKWKVKNEKLLTILSLAVTLASLLLLVEELRRGQNNLTFFILLTSLMIMGLLGSIAGLILRCQILENRLIVLEERIK